MPNRLANASSLYLRQHADNPVEWFPWSAEALEKARREDKPILVSIGYSACHWCHVMAHESFEDTFIADLMNEHFVCIKVDREERPDLDHLYMESVQMMNNGQGGWPLNVFCLPDGRPFAGGTYFPPDERRGGHTIAWPQLLARVSDYFRSHRADLEENASAIMRNLAAGNAPVQLTGDPLPPEALLTAAESLISAFDETYGGFGQAPKFPPAMNLDFLLAVRASAAVESGRPALAKRCDEVINRTLTAMAHGGLFDQIGGGFSRYCVDREWIIPHFEKMLYDNGLLLAAYSRAYRRYPKSLYKAVVAETVAWLEREMAAPGGGYYCALDADSEGEEGRFYVWTPAELEEVLGAEQGAAFAEAYGVTEAGNFEDGRSQPVLLESEFERRVHFSDARAQLHARREQRVRPGRDEKRLVSWNCLAVIGLAEAAWTFGERDWLRRARAVVDWMWMRLVSGEGAALRLAHGAYEADAFGEGNLDDYAALAEAHLAVAAYVEWIEAGAGAGYVERARQLVAAIEAHFFDPAALGFFFTDARQSDVLQRKKEWFDNAVPAGHSHLLQVLRDLAQVDGSIEMAERATKLSAAYAGFAHRAPQAIGHALSALTQAAVGVATIKVSPPADVEALRAALVQRPYRRVLIARPEAWPAGGDFQLCVGPHCLAPTNEVDFVAAQL